MSNINSIIDKVQKLLALSKSSNANEAAAAAAAANKLIDQYRLSEADISTSDNESDPLIRDNDPVYTTGRIVPWKSNLIIYLAKHYGCAIFNDVAKPNGRKYSQYKLVGRSSDIKITKYMFSWLSMECQRLCESDAYGKGKVFTQSYCQGFVAGVNQQLSQSREEVKKQASSSAIIKIDARLDEANDYMNSLYNLKKAPTSSVARINPNAYDAGLNRGKSIHLGKVIVNTPGIKLLGA
ncbi:DUF2786 domain-containing protein [bacterium]|nr:DUF2786 domain-containing protein [bacterium]